MAEIETSRLKIETLANFSKTRPRRDLATS